MPTPNVREPDITISGAKVSDKLFLEIKTIIHRNGLRYHKEKRFSGVRAREITGVVLDRGQLKLPHRQHRKIYELRREIGFAPGDVEREALNRKLQGHVAQAGQVARANASGLG